MSELVIEMIGKDSVPGYYKLEVPAYVERFVKKLQKGKKPEDELFSVGSGAVNAFLKEVDSCFSPKLFRTALGTQALVQYLKDNRIDKNAPDYEKLATLKRANLEAGKRLNHRSGIGKTKVIDTSKIDARIATAKDRVKTFIAAGKTNQASKASQMVEKLMTERDLKLDIGNVSLGTSLKSYVDPRVIFSWCKDVDYPVERIFGKNNVQHFQWAGGVSKTFWRKYP